jgi:hypothetical protein
MCASVLPSGSPALPHGGCKSIGAQFIAVHNMSYTAYSILLSASRLSERHISVLSDTLKAPACYL